MVAAALYAMLSELATFIISEAISIMLSSPRPTPESFSSSSPSISNMPGCFLATASGTSTARLSIPIPVAIFLFSVCLNMSCAVYVLSEVGGKAAFALSAISWK